MSRYPVLFWMIVLGVLITSPALAQAPPSSDIYLITFGEGDISAPANLTNRDGYDNQPHFASDGSGIYYTSQREDQSDIYFYDFETGESRQVTQTPESEYSPTPLPSGDGFSVIRVEADGTQRLWKFDNEGQNAAPVFEKIKAVGYHAWVDATHVAMFIVDDNRSLMVADANTGKWTIHAERIGRSLHPVPRRGGFSYVSKQTEDAWTINVMDLGKSKANALVTTLPGREDYAWHPRGLIYMGDDSGLYRWQPGSTEWTPVLNVADFGIENITRLAISPDGRRLAFVANH